MTDEKLHTAITADNGFRGTAKRTIRVEVTADVTFEGEFTEIREAVHDVLDDDD